MEGAMASRLLSRLPRGYRTDRHFGLVYDEIPSGADDLTMIRGIAARDAVVLNRLGVYFIAQIGMWRHYESTAFAEELRVSPQAIAQNHWIEQARLLCGESISAHPVSAPHLPASFLRTITLLTCSLLFGFFCVYLLGSRQSQMLRGVLSADITTLKSPAVCQLVATHVKPGDEVFSGSTLLTLEKASHLTTIEVQQRRVQQMQQELRQAEAKSDLEISWRVGEIERELFDTQSQITALQHVQQLPEAPRTASVSEDAGSLMLSPVSSSKIHDRTIPQAGGMMFFSGPTGKFSRIPLEIGMPPLPLPTQSAPNMIAHAFPASVSEPVATAIVNLQTQSLEARIERLESQRAALPEQVRQAAGIEHMRQRYTEASRLLEEMQSVSRELSIISPSYGIIGQLRFREGDQLTEGEILLKILHTDRRYVTVYVPTNRVNDLQPGSSVELIFPGRKSYRGQVTDLPMLADTVYPGGETLTSVRVEPTGRLWPQIPIGSQIDVVISR